MHKMLDINDLGIGLIGSDQSIRSPGYASLEGKNLIFGESAREVFRLHPARSANQFWRDLNTQKVAVSFPGVRHQADLVWNHLNAFDKATLNEVSLVAVPSHYGKDQIALLSGILQSLEVGTSLLCKRALLMANLFPEVEYQIDFQLHQLVITKIENTDGELSCGEMTEYPGLGLLGCCDAVLKDVQARFINKTRFDPLHHAETEQQLFNQLIDGLFEKSWDRMDLKVEMGDLNNSVELSEKHLIDAASEYLQKIQKVLPSDSFVADAVFACLPLGRAADRDRYLADDQFSEASASLLSKVTPETEFSELTALRSPSPKRKPVESNRHEEKLAGTDSNSVESSTKAPVAEAKSNSASVQATHLLCKGNAVPANGLNLVSAEGRLGWSLQSSGQLLGSCSVNADGLILRSSGHLRVNGKAAASAQLLFPDDVISHDEIAGALVAIEVAAKATDEAGT